MHALVADATGLDFTRFSNREEAAAAMAAKGLHVPELADSVGRLLNETFEQAVESTLIQPTFVTDYRWRFLPWPARIAPNADWWNALNCSSSVGNMRTPSAS